MKKGIAMFLSAALVMSSFVQTFAAEPTDSSLEKAINNAKAKIDIPAEYTKFDYSVNGYNGEKSWRLTWSAPNDSKEKGTVNIQIDDTGVITNYNKYSQNDENFSTSKLPKYSRQSAEEVAKAFVEKVQPGIASKLESENDSYRYLGMVDYYFNFHYVQEGVPYYGFNCSVNVDSRTGEVKNYYANKITDMVFPSKAGVVSKDTIEKMIIAGKGLELRYMQSYNDDNFTIYPAYTLTQSGKTQYDAFTGEVVKGTTDRIYYDGYLMADKAALTAASGDFGNMNANNLTKQELDAVKKIANVMSSEDAEKTIRAIPELKLDDTYKVNYFNLYKNNKNKDQYIWNMSFQKVINKDTTAKAVYSDYVSASIDAETGKIINFGSGNYGDPTKEYTVDYATAKATAEALAKKLDADKFAQTELFPERSTPEVMPADSYKSPNYSFTFRRVVNGIPVDGDYISVGVNATNGNINNYAVEWYNGQFPAIDKIIPVEQAYKVLFEKSGVVLNYVNTQVNNEILPKTDDKVKGEIKLVYMVDSRKPTSIDAIKGVIIDYQGKPYVEKVTKQYTDIGGHFSEQAVKVLQEFGVGFDSDKFLPDQNITQAEFLELIMKSLDAYFTQNISQDKQQDYIYDNLMRRGIINKDEIAPDSKLSREDAVKFIIRNMGLKKAADIEGIYVSDFKDASSISEGLIGYVCIAKGLNVISGYNGYFMPKETMTRGEAAVLLYNSLK